MYDKHGALAGLILVLDARELDAVRNGALVHHSVPNCFDVRLAQPVPVVVCSAENVIKARAMIDVVYALTADEDEVEH